MKDTWHTTELKRHLKKNWHETLSDSKTVFLSNPTQRKELDSIIKEYFYPALVRATKDSPVSLTSGKDGNFFENIEEEWKIHTTKSLTFLLEDPERPLVPQSNIRWFCRGKIECSAVEYMIHLDFYIYFPESLSIKKIISLLKEPAFVAMPPQLDYQSSTDEVGVFCVEFSKGIGKGWGLTDLEVAGNHIYGELQKILGIIYALNELEVDYKSTKLFNNLSRALIEGFEAV